MEKKIQDPSVLVAYILKEFRKFPFSFHLSAMFALQTIVFLNFQCLKLNTNTLFLCEFLLE